jgi:serine phosphatase RsbU (regulator of sigma subunit)
VDSDGTILVSRRLANTVNQHTFERFVLSLSGPSRAVLFLGIFCLFATFGFLTDIMNGGRHSAAHVVFDVAFSGLMAVLLTFVTTRRPRAFWPMVLGQTATAIFISVMAPRLFNDTTAVPDGTTAVRLILDSAATMVAVMCGYAAIAAFLTRESARFLRMRAEMTLAREIHRGLVPALAGRVGGIEFAGASHPSGEVGGDLVDVFTFPREDRCVAYVADVSGHGVHAGVVMGMVKSAARMALRRRASLEELFEDLNETLVPLLHPAMFVTAAAIEAGPDGVRVSVAGHLPILHLRSDTGVVDEISVSNVALGFFPGQLYAAVPVACRPGDTLALITDGYIEVFDREDRELGLNTIKETLAGTAAESLQAMLSALSAASSIHGAQLDDQSALLLRIVAAR